MEQKTRRKPKRKPAQLLPRINSRPSFIDIRLKEFLSSKYSQSRTQTVNSTPEIKPSSTVLERLTNNLPLKQTLIQRERFRHISGGTPVQKAKVAPHREKPATGFIVPKRVFVLDGERGIRFLTVRRLLDPKANWLSHKQCRTRSNKLLSPLSPKSIDSHTQWK